ncbi:uncharacterized protein LOC144223912 isoform X2 [Crocuta crocuta]
MTETLPSVCPHPTHECTSKSVCLSQEIHQLKGLMEKIIYQVNTMSYFEAHGDEAEASCNFAAYAGTESKWEAACEVIRLKGLMRLAAFTKASFWKAFVSNS